jgi:hypothetical protein
MQLSILCAVCAGIVLSSTLIVGCLNFSPHFNLGYSLIYATIESTMLRRKINTQTKTVMSAAPFTALHISCVIVKEVKLWFQRIRNEHLKNYSRAYNDLSSRIHLCKICITHNCVARRASKNTPSCSGAKEDGAEPIEIIRDTRHLRNLAKLQKCFPSKETLVSAPRITVVDGSGYDAIIILAQFLCLSMCVVDHRPVPIH